MNGVLHTHAQSDQQHDSTSWNYHPDKSSPVATAAAGEGFHSDRLAEPMSSAHRYGMPPVSSPPGQRFHLNREFSEVLERGSLEDVARLIDSTAPQPEVRDTHPVIESELQQHTDNCTAVTTL